jgi:glycerol uptake facilitator protein
MGNAPMAEFLGTMMLVLLGDGVVANVVLNRTKGNSSGWIVITAGWAFAVTVGVYLSKSISGAHLNPAVTIAMAATGSFSLVDVPIYLVAQMCGAIAGAVLVYLAYRPHFAATSDKDAKLAVFATGPAIKSPIDNLICETIGTFALMFGLLTILTPANFEKGSPLETGFSPVLVGLLVWSIGVSLGGPTGYAINPARDLGPRIAHAILPIPNKGPSNWGYAWVPVAGPILGATIAAFLHQVLHLN